MFIGIYVEEEYEYWWETHHIDNIMKKFSFLLAQQHLMTT
jgi:hypothetical protein